MSATVKLLQVYQRWKRADSELKCSVPTRSWTSRQTDYNGTSTSPTRWTTGRLWNHVSRPLKDYISIILISILLLFFWYLIHPWLQGSPSNSEPTHVQKWAIYSDDVHPVTNCGKLTPGCTIAKNLTVFVNIAITVQISSYDYFPCTDTKKLGWTDIHVRLTCIISPLACFVFLLLFCSCCLTPQI